MDTKHIFIFIKIFGYNGYVAYLCVSISHSCTVAQTYELHLQIHGNEK